jgi:hypothetical protein
MVSSVKLRRVDFVRTNDSEELSASFIRVTRIGKLGTTLAVTSNRRTLRRIRRLETLRIKRTKLLCTPPFLLRCRDHNTIPRFLQNACVCC